MLCRLHGTERIFNFRWQILQKQRSVHKIKACFERNQKVDYEEVERLVLCQPSGQGGGCRLVSLSSAPGSIFWTGLPKSHFLACAGQADDQEQPAGLYQGSRPTFFPSMRKWVILWIRGKTFNFVYLDFSQAFKTVCHSTLTDKLEGEGLDRCTLRPVEKWRDLQAQSGVHSLQPGCG